MFGAKYSRTEMNVGNNIIGLAVFVIFRGYYIRVNNKIARDMCVLFKYRALWL